MQTTMISVNGMQCGAAIDGAIGIDTTTGAAFTS
jgi:hypothetical protein